MPENDGKRLARLMAGNSQEYSNIIEIAVGTALKETPEIVEDGFMVGVKPDIAMAFVINILAACGLRLVAVAPAEPSDPTGGVMPPEVPE